MKFPTETVVLLLSILGFIFAVVSTFTPAWTLVKESSGIFKVGHIQGCRSSNGSERCLHMVRLLLNDHEERVSFTFMVFSIAFAFLSALFMRSGMTSTNLEHFKIGGYLSLAGGISAFIGVVVYTEFTIRNDVPNSGLSFGYSYGLAWVTSILCLLSGVLSLLHYKQPNLHFIKVRRTRISTVSSSNDAC